MIVDASAINSIDITAADRLDAISASLKKRGIRFYLTEHSTQINDQLRQFGIGHMIKDGMVRRTILAALHDAGIEAPYELDVPKEDETKLLRRSIAFLPAEEENTLEEFAWAFGDDAVKEIEESVHHIIEQLHQIPDIQRLSEEGLEELLDNWHGLGVLDEDELLTKIELHMDELPEELTSDRKLILHLLEKRRGRHERKNPCRASGSPRTAGTAPEKAGRTAGKAESGSCSEMEALEGRASQRLISAYIPFPGP